MIDWYLVGQVTHIFIRKTPKIQKKIISKSSLKHTGKYVQYSVVYILYIFFPYKKAEEALKHLKCNTKVIIQK